MSEEGKKKPTPRKKTVRKPVAKKPVAKKAPVKKPTPVKELSFAERVARTCHEVNRAYCEGHGDFTQVPWDEAPQWVHDSAMQGVKFFHENPLAVPEDMHMNWCKQKMATGWKYGETKDPLKKEHPCLVSYSKLPFQQRAKDTLFLSTVKSFVTLD